MGTEIRDEKELNANRQIIEDTLRATFSAPDGKLDLNNSAADQLADQLREPLLQAGVALSEQELQDVVKNIEDFRASKGGLLNSLDQLSGVKGVTPQVLAARQAAVRAGAIYDSFGRSGGAEDRQGSAAAGDFGHAVCAGRDAGLYRLPLRMDLRRGGGGRGIPRHHHYDRTVLAVQ